MAKTLQEARYELQGTMMKELQDVMEKMRANVQDSFLQQINSERMKPIQDGNKTK
jgi:hypothetical protein